MGENDINAIRGRVHVLGMGRGEIVNWVPKEDGNSDLGRRRPLVYYEVMREISVGIKKAQVMAVWKNNGWIDEDNYGFQAGMSVKEPIIITKMIMEDAMARGKKLRVIDVDFAAAYDRSERFAKDMSLRRLGVPKEGLSMDVTIL